MPPKNNSFSEKALTRILGVVQNQASVSVKRANLQPQATIRAQAVAFQELVEENLLTRMLEPSRLPSACPDLHALLSRLKLR